MHNTVQKRCPRPPISSDESHRAPRPGIQNKNRAPLSKPVLSPILSPLHSLSLVTPLHYVAEANPLPERSKFWVDRRRGKVEVAVDPANSLCSLSGSQSSFPSPRPYPALVFFQVSRHQRHHRLSRTDTGGGRTRLSPCMQDLCSLRSSRNPPPPIPSFS
jgi:hypothetical protein